MTDPLRTTALSLAWTLVACHRGGETVSEPIIEPGPIAEVEVDHGALPITAVPQLTPLEISEWVFEPGSRRFATGEFLDCSIFDVETGRLITSMENVDGSPCATWLPAENMFSSDVSSDGRLEVDTSNGKLEIIESESGKQLRALPCPNCATFELITWSRTGHQLAIAWMDPPRVEVWDADAGKRIYAEQIPVSGELDELELGWTEGGATVTWTEQGFPVECEGYQYDCYYDDATQRSVQRPASRRALVLGAAGKHEIPLGDQLGLMDVTFDPEGRWAFWHEEWSEGRSGTTTQITFAGMAGQVDAAQWTIEEDIDDYGGYRYTRQGAWRTDGVTHWAVYETNDDYDGSPVEIMWETIIMSPPLGRRAGTVDMHDATGELSMVPLGFVGDALRVFGELCDEEGTCTPIGVPPAPGCELLDGASVHGAELFDCEGQLFMRSSGGMKRLPHDPAAIEWFWSRGGALVLNDGSMFTVLDAASGVGNLQRNESLTVFEGRLGLELDRLAVTTDAGLEVVNLTAGKVIASFPDLFPDDVAFSPNGDRIAVSSGGQIRVHALPSAEMLVSWAADSAELAFRQDGKVIFTGMGAPTLAFEAATGKPLASAGLESMFEAANVGEIDPSWRWIVDDEAGQIVRTLDGLTLAWMDTGAWLPATGQFQGSGPGPEVAYRVGNDAMVVPEFDAAQLAKWLGRADLVELFLGGQPIPKPTMTPGELAGVRAAVESKK